MIDESESRLISHILDALNLGVERERLPETKNTIYEWCKNKRIGSVKDFELIFHSEPTTVQRLIDNLVVSETYFFRHPAHFDFIRTTLENASDLTGKHFKILSAGCATGEEAYSIAMLLDELSVSYSVTGWDISSSNISTAEEGIYSDWSIRNRASFPALMRYLGKCDGNKVKVAGDIRNKTTFQCLNLLSENVDAYGNYHNHFDFILCRNLMIYLRQQDANKLAKKLINMLRPDGWLLPGPSDPITTYLELLSPQETSGGLVFHKTMRSHSHGPSSDALTHTTTYRKQSKQSSRSVTIMNTPQRQYDEYPDARHDERVQTCDQRSTASTVNHTHERRSIHQDRVDSATTLESQHYFKKALEQWELGDLQRALILLDKAVYIEPTEPIFPYFKGKIFHTLKKNDFAIRQLQLAQQMLSSSGHSSADVEFSQSFTRDDDLENAIAWELKNIREEGRGQ
jgi:chemotaxis protein methyltransferase CheR